ncbi:helix-turn-helix domain-containing protein [Goodfellowiella coeruleoviolacea]|uniref:Helix-turn-helix domain-containing protein n=1 Tax=Goodfellowiella coeruleoviolacea TaxID=334858 RepID=A0AAE3GGN3_9PSEU|nr:helix-turn-helix transcriptional regulator [Goodfellowiella coeruleoviolacea]MCP2165778.1 Helix-turn-helix domain-containing protein [Goodfellowiella coeruleoviolacea]
MGPIGSPVLRRRRLGQELRRLREAAGKRLDDVAEYLECSDAKISRIETGKVPVLTRDVRDMLDFYGVPNGERESLLDLAKEAKHQGYWERATGSMPKIFAHYLALEAEAVEILNYEPLMIPGLLQTPSYARALMMIGSVTDPERIEQKVRLRMERQKRLTDPDNPLRLHAIVDEAVFNRQVGGKQVIQDQFAHIAKMAELPNVTIQYVSYEEGAYFGMGASFAVLTFADPEDGAVVYQEMDNSVLFLESPNDVEQYKLLFKKMSRTAEGSEGTAEFFEYMSKRR